MSSSLNPLLGRTRSLIRGAIRLSHRAGPSGHSFYGEVDELDSGGQHGQRSVFLRHTHRPQRRPYPIYTSRSWRIYTWK